ncbi:MAG TPA: hypothetical protein VKT80_00815, partial [Chloroflexota bacterium]|nr:hypothetical protein [Chloroflexota bacterium]
MSTRRLIRILSAIAFLGVSTSAFGGSIAASSPLRVDPGGTYLAERPKIAFNPRLGQYGIAYLHDLPLTNNEIDAEFLNQDGAPVTGPFFLAPSNSADFSQVIDVLPFPASTEMLSTYAIGWEDINFLSNTFLSDASGVAFSSDGNFDDAMVDYTNDGSDKSKANNCGED